MFADVIKRLRFEHDLSQADLGKIVGLAQQSVGQWEKEGSEPAFSVLIALAEYFDVTIDYLLGRTDERSAEVKKYPAGNGRVMEAHQYQRGTLTPEQVVELRDLIDRVGVMEQVVFGDDNQG